MNNITSQIPAQNEPKELNKSVLKQYEIAISLMEYHTNLLWLEFGAFLLAVTIILGALGQEVTLEDCQGIPVIILSTVGLILCILWWATFEHNYKYYLLRIAQARQHESVLGYSLLSSGHDLSSGETVTIDKEEIRFGFLARMLPPRRAVRLLIILFGTIFILIISSSLFGWV